MRRIHVLLLASILVRSRGLGDVYKRQADAATVKKKTVDVMFVGNNWDGTIDVLNAASYKRIKRINVIPDKDQRLTAIRQDPAKLGFYLAIQQLVGEGHDQFVDDMFSTHDGKILAVSRPSLADVVGVDLLTQKQVWRFPMEGYRTDHMGVSPDGKKLLVSDSTANKVHELDLRTGKKLREFPSGDTPHESNYTRKGDRISHASIGRVYVPADLTKRQPAAKIAKGEQVFQIVDNKTFKILKKWDMGQKMDEAGYRGFSSAVRPMAIAPDERFVYLQLSYLHGFVEFDTTGEGKVTRVAMLPQSDEAKKTPTSQYQLNSAHHGVAMNPSGTKLCAAGTMSDYAAIVDRKTFGYKILPVSDKPYWSTNGVNGTTCWMSVSGLDKVVVIDYAKAKIIKQIAVSDHPQRVREGMVGANVVKYWHG